MSGNGYPSSPPPGYDPGDLPPDALGDGGAGPIPDARIKFPRRFVVVMDDAGGFVVQETRDETHIVMSVNGQQIAPQQRIVQRIAAARVDVVELFHEWCNRFSDVAVAGLRADDEKQRRLI